MLYDIIIVFSGFMNAIYKINVLVVIIFVHTKYSTIK